MSMRRFALAVVVLVIGQTLSAAPRDPRPQVRIGIDLRGGIATDLQNERAACEADVLASVRSILQTRFPYLEWVTSGDAAQTLTLTVTERQASGDVENVLTYVATIGGNAGSGAPPQHVLYPWTDPPPPDPTELKRDLVARIAQDVARSEAALKQYFVSHIAVVRRIDIEQHFIVLPVEIHPESGFFVVNFSDASARPGEIQLTGPFEGGSGVYCSIQAFRYAGEPPIDAPWSDAIPTVVRQKAQNVEVKVKEFTPKPFANTSGGVVTAIPGGGAR